MPFLTRLRRCCAQCPNSKRHALNINILMLINLKVIGQRKMRLTKTCRQCVEGGCSHDCAAADGTADLVSLSPEFLCVARSPLMQCLRIQGCFCTSVRGMRFSGSSTSNFRTRVSMYSPSMSLGLGTYPFNQVFSLGTHELRHRHLSPRYSSLCHHWRVLEWCLPNQEFVGQDAQTP